MTLDYATNALTLRTARWGHGAGTGRARNRLPLGKRGGSTRSSAGLCEREGAIRFCAGHRRVQHSDLARSGGGVRTRCGENFAADGWRREGNCVAGATEIIGSRRSAAGEFGGGGFRLFYAAQRGVGKQVAGHSGLRLSAALPRDARLPTRGAQLRLSAPCPSACAGLRRHAGLLLR